VLLLDVRIKMKLMFVRMNNVVFMDVSMIMVAFANVRTTVVDLDIITIIIMAFEGVRIVMAMFIDIKMIIVA
jgi:hypothetical protein